VYLIAITSSYVRLSMLLRLLFILVLTFAATTAVADDTVSADEDPESDQTDVYYNAMIRSIDLDKTRWKPFSRSMESGPWFYDTQSTIRNGQKVSVMVTAFPHPQKSAIYSSVYSDHSKIRKIVFETEINCSAHSYRQPRIRVYGYYKELLAEHTNNSLKFSSIKKGTTTDTLMGLVCGTGNKKRR
jgi:hypothetical protein